MYFFIYFFLINTSNYNFQLIALGAIWIFLGAHLDIPFTCLGQTWWHSCWTYKSGNLSAHKRFSAFFQLIALGIIWIFLGAHLASPLTIERCAFSCMAPLLVGLRLIWVEEKVGVPTFPFFHTFNQWNYNTTGKRWHFIPSNCQTWKWPCFGISVDIKSSNNFPTNAKPSVHKNVRNIPLKSAAVILGMT